RACRTMRHRRRNAPCRKPFQSMRLSLRLVESNQPRRKSLRTMRRRRRNAPCRKPFQSMRLRLRLVESNQPRRKSLRTMRHRRRNTWVDLATPTLFSVPRWRLSLMQGA
ncbi:MAG: hypothetical protein IKH04_00670, partial [Kiritimatiellae bacterium]|nr:hypothetical protein [Kiritimatiellia bacterium]